MSIISSRALNSESINTYPSVVQTTFGLEVVGRYSMGLTHYDRDYAQNYRVAEDALEGFELYLGEGSMPNFNDVAQPVATSATLPFNYSPTLPGPGNTTVLYAVTRKRNKYGLLSNNQHPSTIEIDENGDEVLGTLTAPILERVLDGNTAGSLQAWAQYIDDNDRTPANQWELYAEIGTTPDPSVDTPLLTDTIAIVGDRKPPWRGAVTGLVDGTAYNVLVAVRRTADNAYASSNVLAITLADLFDMTLDDTSIFAGTIDEIKS